MLLSASRRTDIPACFSDWFFNRLREGFVLVRNPYRHHQVRKLSLSPKVVDGIVFWTKNPAPMLDRLSLLGSIPYYFQFTLTPYDIVWEPGLPDKRNTLIPLFQRLAEQIGPDRVLWRYDPILLDSRYTAQAHLEAFGEFADRLKGYTRCCTISFLDRYPGIHRTLEAMGAAPPAPADCEALAQGFSKIARACGIRLFSCAEELPLERYGIPHGRCVDSGLLGELGGIPLQVERDQNQRPACGCAASVDIGAYGTCSNGCRYCYANRGRGPAGGHNPQSPLLTGELGPEDVIKEKILQSCQLDQQSLY